jgi:hypothetical protein
MHTSNTHPAVTWFITVLGILWATFLLAITIDKLRVWGFQDEFQHFTNWAWILYATSGSLLIVTYKVRGALRTWTCAIFAIFFIPCWLIAVVVLLVVLLFLVTGATFIIDIVRSTPVSEVIIGNEVMHLLPVITYIVVALVNTRLLYFSINEMLATVNQDRKIFWAIVFAEVYLVPNIPLAFYRVFNDPAVVYGSNLNQLLGLAYILAVETVFGGLLLFVAVAMFGLGEKHLKDEFIDGDSFLPETMIMQSQSHAKSGAKAGELMSGSHIFNY